MVYATFTEELGMRAKDLEKLNQIASKTIPFWESFNFKCFPSTPTGFTSITFTSLLTKTGEKLPSPVGSNFFKF